MPQNGAITRAPKSEPPAAAPQRKETTAYGPEESAAIRGHLVSNRGPSPAPEAPAAPARKATIAYSAAESANIRAAILQAARIENAGTPAGPPASHPPASYAIAVNVPNIQNPAGEPPTNSGGTSPVQGPGATASPPPARHTLAYSPQESSSLQAQLNANTNRPPTDTPRVTHPGEASRPAHVATIANGPPVRKGTMAYSSEESAVVREQLAAAQPSHPELAADVNAADVNAAKAGNASGAVVTLLSRDADPTPASPLLYRERCYFAPAATDRQSAHALLTQELLALQHALAGRDRGILVSLALFDHFFEVRPERGPLATLEWKDWRGEPVFAWHGPAPATPATRIGAPSAHAEIEHSPHESGIRAPSAALATPLATAPAASDAWAGRDVTGEQDRRLAHAFEAAQDLYFLGSVADGLDFGVKLLAELIPCEAISGCLYDINTNEFRFVALTGPGADERRAQAVPATSGLMGIAAHAPEDFLLLRSISADERFDPIVDGRAGITPRNMLLFPMRSGETLLGILQLINRDRRDFSDADLSVGAYIAKQLGEFLQSKRASVGQPR